MIGTTVLRHAARLLVAACQTAIHAGAWAVDDGNDPETAIDRLDKALGRPAGDQEIANLVADLVDVAVPAVVMGEWAINEDDLAAVVEASGIAMAHDAGNDDEPELAQAA